MLHFMSFEPFRFKLLIAMDLCWTFLAGMWFTGVIALRMENVKYVRPFVLWFQLFVANMLYFRLLCSSRHLFWVLTSNFYGVVVWNAWVMSKGILQGHLFLLLIPLIIVFSTALWFKEGELCEWAPVQAPWLREWPFHRNSYLEPSSFEWVLSSNHLYFIR